MINQTNWLMLFLKLIYEFRTNWFERERMTGAGDANRNNNKFFTRQHTHNLAFFMILCTHSNCIHIFNTNTIVIYNTYYILWTLINI